MKEKRKCSIKGCKGKYIEAGYCGKHYQRIRHGINNMCLENIYHPGPIKHGNRNPRWNGGTSEYPNHSLMKKNRIEVLEEVNHICQKCGGRATKIHHKDLSKTNHSKENLMAVCNKCNCKIRHKPNTSKYKKLYGYKLFEIAKLLKLNSASVSLLHKNNQLIITI